MDYPKVGVSGTAYIRRRHFKKTALVHFNHFLESKDLPRFDPILEEEVCSIDLFREFGFYLAFHARSSKTEELLMCGTALTYLSAVKEEVIISPSCIVL